MPEIDDELPEDIESEVVEASSTGWPGASPRQAAFLTALVISGGDHRGAATASKVARSTHYLWIETDQAYRMLHERAMARVTEILEDEARRRALKGVRKGVYYQGERIGFEQLYSDGLMMFMLRAANPEKYREQHEVKGTLDLTHKFAGTMEELLAVYAAILAKKTGSEPEDDK